jgi:predicted site-specific integrase-resolvase
MPIQVFLSEVEEILVLGIQSEHPRFRYMQRAALHARVSTDAQKQEGTIESQIVELRRQIAAAGHVLVKEYIDDGYTGSRMDRPALQELRRDLSADVFDVIYFPRGRPYCARHCVQWRRPDLLPVIKRSTA